MKGIRHLLVYVILMCVTFGQAQTVTKSTKYSETDFVKMQQHYKKDTEVIEMMKLESMAGNENAIVFLKFLDLTYEEASEKYGGEVVNRVIHTYYESSGLVQRFTELNDQLDASNAEHNRSVSSSGLTPHQYFEHAQFIWNELVPKSGQAKVVAGEMLRAVEKLRDEARRNANANFHDGCHTRLIDYLRTELNDSAIFDMSTIEAIFMDLNRLELEAQPYTGNDIYDRLSNRVVDWFLYYGGTEAHENDPNLQC